MNNLLSLILEGLLQAFNLLFSGDPEIYGIMFLSLRVSGIAIIFATCIALPLGAFLGLKEFPGRQVIINTVNTFMGFPPVVAGLLIYLMISSQGPLGFLDILFQPEAMILAQFLLAIPIVMGTCSAAIRSVDPLIKDTARSLGATEPQMWWAMILESRIGILSGIAVAFGHAISEVGAIMIVGGNIRYRTRALTTAIVLNTRMGEFEFALALGILLLFMSFITNVLITRLQAGAAR